MSIIEEKCKQKGVRLTDQRKVIAKVLSESKEVYGSKDHPDVDELHKRVTSIDDKISAGGHNYKLTGVGVEVALNDALSISYSEEESVKKSYGAAVNAAAGASPFTRTEIAFESTFLMLAYDIGGATVGLTSVESSNSGYTSGADTTKTLATLSMAF